MRFLCISLVLCLGALAFGQSFTLRRPYPIASITGCAFDCDSMESYADAAAVDGLNGGNNWGAAYVDRINPLGLQQYDDLESYADGATLDTLNAGIWTGGAYVDRRSVLGLWGNDDLESYADAAAVNGLNGGTDFGGAYVDR